MQTKKMTFKKWTVGDVRTKYCRYDINSRPRVDCRHNLAFQKAAMGGVGYRYHSDNTKMNTTTTTDAATTCTTAANTVTRNSLSPSRPIVKNETLYFPTAPSRRQLLCPLSCPVPSVPPVHPLPPAHVPVSSSFPSLNKSNSPESVPITVVAPLERRDVHYRGKCQ